MTSELEVTQNNQQLSRALNNASSIITKNYLAKLEEYHIIPPTAEDVDIDIAECGHFYQLRKLVLNKEENFLNKLTTIVNVASAIDCSIATIIKSDGSKIDYYWGIISKKARDWRESSAKRRIADAASFQGALSGNLAGSELKEISKDEVNALKKAMLKDGNCYSAVSGIVALRDKEDKSIEGYVQGIENLVDSLKGHKYTIVMLADPVATNEIQTIKQGYEMLHTQLSSFARSVLTMNENDTLSLSQARTEGISKGISTGISMTQSKTQSNGTFSGVNASLGINFIASANVGFNRGHSSGTSDSQSNTQTSSESTQRNRAVTDTIASSKTEGRSLQLAYENRSVKSLLDKIDKHLERLDRCESFGAFDCAAYVIAETRETALTVASNYNALMRGQESSVQASHINSWYKKEDTNVLGKYIGALVHPRFWQNQADHIIVTPASIVSGNELAIQIGLPKKSVSGISVMPMAPFGRNVIENSARTIILGNLYNMGHDEIGNGSAQKVKIDIESMSMHTFITGSTGAGKSNTIYTILDRLSRERVKFLVIEPAKGEYKSIFGGRPDVSVYGTNPNFTDMNLLRLNPFSFPRDIHVLEHIDRLVEIFNVCWPMYAAMPAILKDSVERAYVSAGWDLMMSTNQYDDHLFPTFADVLKEIKTVLEESDYSADNKGDYTGSLVTRIKSLTNGINGLIFSADDIPDEQLFDENVIIDLSRVGSTETKALIMGLMVLKLQEYRMDTSQPNSDLKHLTVLEEAHNLLKRTSTEQVTEGANLLGKSVEMLANSIAEMRTYGEGFIIADQSPGLLDMSVIRNTNTKIIMRLPDFTDRELVGKAAGLNDSQIIELGRLERGVASVTQNDWLEPILCRVEKFEKKVYSLHVAKNENKTIEALHEPTLKAQILQFLLSKVSNEEPVENVDRLRRQLIRANIPASVKITLLTALQSNQYTHIVDVAKIVSQAIGSIDRLFENSKDTVGIDEFNKSLIEHMNIETSLLSPNCINNILECIIFIESQKLPNDAENYKKWMNIMCREVM